MFFSDFPLVHYGNVQCFALGDQRPFSQKSDCGYRMSEARPLVRVSALCSCDNHLITSWWRQRCTVINRLFVNSNASLLNSRWFCVSLVAQYSSVCNVSQCHCVQQGVCSPGNTGNPEIFKWFSWNILYYYIILTLLKRESCKQHCTIVQGLWFSDSKMSTKFQRGDPKRGHKIIRDLRSIYRYNSETV